MHRKGVHLKKNPKGIFYIHWTEGRRSRRRSTGTGNRQAAESALAAFIVGRSEQAQPEDLLIDFLLDDYWNEHAQHVVAPERIEYALKNLRAYFGSLSVSSIDRDITNEYAAQRRRGEIGRKSGDGTIRRELNCLIAALNHAAKQKRVRKDALPHIELPEEPPGKDRWLTFSEADRLREACQWVSKQNPDTGLMESTKTDEITRVRLFVEIALATAQRRHAIESLRKDQVDLKGGFIRFNPPGRIQTKKRRPTVPIADTLMPYLRWAIKHMPGDYVLGHSGSIRTSFENAVARAGLNKVTPHTLRHTWATWAAQHRVPMWEIAGVLGDTLATTEKRYAHHHPGHLRDAINFRGAA